MSARPDISVVITAHNAAATLPGTLTALAAQTRDADAEIVVVDDRSTDGTSAAIETLGIPQVRILRVEAPTSPNRCTARQHALDVAVRASRAPKILLLDADALPPARWVDEVGDALTRVPLVAGAIAFRSTSHAWRGRLLAALQTIDAGYYLGCCRLLAHIGAPAGMLFGAAGFRRELYDRIGGFCALGFTLIEDLAFARAAHKLGARITFTAGDPVSVRACEGWRDVVGRALRTGTSGGWSLLAVTLGFWGILLPTLGIAAAISGGAWWIALAIRYFAGVAFAATGLQRARRLRFVAAAFIYEPIAVVLAVVVALKALRVREVEWGGVRYPRQGPFVAPNA